MAPCSTTNTNPMEGSTLKTKYQKRPKIACVACNLFGIAKVDSKGLYIFRTHKVDGKVCKGSGKIGFVMTEQEWIRHQANFRSAKMDSCGNCAHRIPKGPAKGQEFLCSVLNQPVHATNVCKHHKQS